MEENNQEKLSSLFNNRFKESLKKSISEKESRILDLQIQSKEANRKRILADYFSQILSEVSTKDMINAIIDKIKSKKAVNSLNFDYAYSSGNSYLTFSIMLNSIDIDIDNENSYLLSYPNIIIKVKDPVGYFVDRVLSQESSAYMNDENEIDYDACKMLASKIDIENAYLRLTAREFSGHMPDFVNTEEFSSKSLEEKIDIIIDTFSDKDYLLNLINNGNYGLYEDININTNPYKQSMIIKNTKAKINEIKELMKIAEIKEEEENE